MGPAPAAGGSPRHAAVGPCGRSPLRSRWSRPAADRARPVLRSTCSLLSLLSLVSLLGIWFVVPRFERRAGRRDSVADDRKGPNGDVPRLGGDLEVSSYMPMTEPGKSGYNCN